MPVLNPPVHGGHVPKLYPYDPECAWTNRMRCASYWAEYTGGSRTALRLSDERADGYPATLPGGVQAWCVVFNGGRQEFPGNWTCKWDGDGTVRMFDGEAHTATGVNGATGVNITITANYNILKVAIELTNPLDPVRNMRVYYTPYETYLKTTEGGTTVRGFDPDFKARWLRSKQNAARFSHWIDVFDSPIETAAEKRPDNYYTECSLDDRLDESQPTFAIGCSWKAIADFCTEFNLAYANITVPLRTWEDAGETWVNDSVTYFVNPANCPVTVRFIYSVANEIWNSGIFFRNYAYIQNIAVNGGPRGEVPRIGAPYPHEQVKQAFALRSWQVFTAAKAIAPTRILGMIDWQSSDSHFYSFPILTRLLSNAAGTPYNPPLRVNYDIYATGCYTGQRLREFNSNAFIETWTTQQFADHVRSDIDNRLFNGPPTEVSGAANYATQDGATWIAYEMGRHEQFSGGTLSNPAFDRLLIYYRSPQCRANILHLCLKARTTGGSGHGFWYHSAGFAFQSPFGLVEDWSDDGGARPGSAGCDDEPSFLAWQEAGATMLGSGGNTPPTLQTPPTQNIVAQAAYSYQLVAFDPDVPPQVLTFTCDNLPPGISCNSQTGLISGAALSPGAWTATAMVNDGAGGQATVIFDYSVSAAAVNQNPVMTQPPPQVAREGVAFSYQLVATDPDPGAVLRYGADPLPAGLACSFTTGLISGTPAAGSSSGGLGGYYNVAAAVRDQFFAADGKLFVIQVLPPLGTNRPPVIQFIGLLQAVEGQAFTFQVVATDPEMDPLTYAMVNQPTGLSINAGNGLITGTPAAGTSNQVPYAVTVAVTDGINPPVGQLFYIQVSGGTPVNRAPVITNPGTRTAFEGRGYELRLVGVDPDPGDTVQWLITGLPPGLDYNQQGVISGVPPFGSARTAAYPVTVTLTDQLGLADTEQFDLFVQRISVGGGGQNNADLYMQAQMVPGFSGGSPSAVGDTVVGCVGYEIGSIPIQGRSRLADMLQEWWAFDYETDADKLDPFAGTFEVRFGVADRWKLVLELNKRGGGAMWRWRLTDTTGAPALVPANFNLLTTADGTGRSFGGNLLFYLPGDDDKLGPVRVAEDGARIGQSRVDTGSDWAGAAAPMANRTPRWTHSAPLLEVGHKSPAAGRLDIETRALPLDWTPTAERGGGGSLVGPRALNMTQRRRTRFNWPRPGIHTTFLTHELIGAYPPTRAWGIAMDVVGLHLHEGFDERHLFDGGNGTPIWTDLSGDVLHAQFTSVMHGSVTEHFHQYLRGRSYLLAILDTTNWPADYRTVGTKLSINVTGVNRTANGITFGLPALPNTNNLKAVVSALGGGLATVQIDITEALGAGSLAPPFTINGLNITGVTYTGGTFTVPALQLHYDTGTGDSLLLRGTATVGTDGVLPSGQAQTSVKKALVTDPLGRAGIVLKCNGINTRAVPGYSFADGFAVGVASALLGDDVVGPRINSAFTYLGASRVTPTTFQFAGTELASAYQKLTVGISQAPEIGLAGSSRLLTSQHVDSLVDADMWTGLPAYIAMGSFAEVQAHFEWLLTNGWLNLPLDHLKYRSVP